MTDTLERPRQQAPELPPPESPRRHSGMGPVFLSALAILVVAAVAFILSGSDPVAGAPTETDVTEAAVDGPVAVVGPAAPAGLTAQQAAEAARWEGLAEAYATVVPGPNGLTAVQRVEALRWTELADFVDLSDVWAIESLRLTELAAWLTSSDIGADGLTDAQRAEAARLTALAEWYVNR